MSLHSAHAARLLLVMDRPSLTDCDYRVAIAEGDQVKAAELKKEILDVLYGTKTDLATSEEQDILAEQISKFTRNLQLFAVDG